ncbi:unnamed protein product [Pieris brassicae]|uniref:Histone-lysine N-methyltransferase n=1 Tax=Pieris brassicae TaxID=7116 RepID=A0A9P0XEA4_PIEBR|nr:unnamed protein product [Pieris brassicae]
MHTDDDDPTNKKKDKIDTSPDDPAIKVNTESPKKDTKEDPKPRIVLTFRSDKSGAKNSNMKIVCTEEKHEEAPRRSNRNRNAKWESDDEDSPKKDKSQVASESDEMSDSAKPKHSSRRRGKEGSDVLANAIARKEKYNEAATTSTRLSRRIKPTAKALANEELRMYVELQNNSRLGITDKSSEEGVKTRRSAQKVDNSKKMEDSTGEDSDNSEMKLKHLCGLGLKSVEMKTDEESAEGEAENRESERENEEGEDDDTEVIVKLLEADEDSDSVSSGDYFLCSSASQVDKPRRSRRLCSMYGTNDSDRSSPILIDEEPLVTTRRKSRRANTRPNEDNERTPASKKQRTNSSAAEDNEDQEENSNSAPADEGPTAASPTGSSTVFATCTCEDTTSNIHALPSDLIEPVFCQAIEIVDGLRVGCSHKAPRDDEGNLLPMRRSGARAPYLILCKLHLAQMAKHMCCPACGLFCTQGSFYQCSENHLFHLECGVPYGESRSPGCPHCGVLAFPWRAFNTSARKIQLTMHCSNKRVYLPDQREHCTPAYLSFTPIEESKVDRGPIFPEDLLPLLPDLEKMCESVDFESGDCMAFKLYEGIIAEENVELLIPKIVKTELNTPIADIEGGTCTHAAAVSGQLGALYLLQYAGADLDAVDNLSRTPLMRAVLALLEKEPEEGDTSIKESIEVKKEGDEDKTEEVMAVDDAVKEDEKKVNKDDIMRVIRFLLAAGCDPNLQGPEGMTALHMAAQHGGVDVCTLLIEGGGHVDAKEQGGWTPLVRAAENCHPQVVRLLIQRGADASSTDCEGNGVIHWCALSGDGASLQLLLDAAPHVVNTANAHADTPLHIAAREGHYPCVVILLARGARTDIENSSAELPIHVSSGTCRSSIVVNMKVVLATGGPFTKYRLLTSDISNGREPYPVPCVNEVDDEPVPSDFTYVSRHIHTEQIYIDNMVQVAQSCECTDGRCIGTCACGILSVRSWYVGDRLSPSFPHHDPPMIFECNHTCTCNVNRCTNRVVGRLQSRGSIACPVQVYRTVHRGWGLRTRHRVKRGALVVLYCGELLSCPTADARAMDQYMFALDVKQDLIEQCNDQTQLCVDAAKYGSAARFINHSCRPNLAPVRVFTECRDLRLPTVALFALTDIAAMEELTFDYGEKFWSVKSKWMKCECGTLECRYPTISTPEDLDA